MCRVEEGKPLMKLDVVLKVVNVLAGILTIINSVNKLLKG